MSRLKIAIIGAGSVGFTKRLVTDILCVPELQDVEFALTDISQHNLAMVRQILDRLVEANRLPTKDHRHDRPAQGARGRPLRDQLRARRRSRSLRRRHSHPAEIWRRPVRRRHDLRRRHPLRPAQHPGHPGLLPGHSRGRGNRRELPELRQPDGDEHVGGDRIRQGQHHRPLPRRAAWRRTDRGGARREGQKRARIHLLGNQPPDLVRRHPLPRTQDREGRACSPPSSGTRSIHSRKRCASTSSGASASTRPSRTATCPNTCPGTGSGRKRSAAGSTCLDWIHGETGGYLRHSTETRNPGSKPTFRSSSRKPASRSIRPSARPSTPATSSRRSRPADATAAISMSRTTA